MGFNVTSKKFYDAFTGIGGGGTTYFNASIGDKITCVVKGYFKWSLESKTLNFASSTKKISLANQFDSSSFIQAEFKVDDQIEVVGSSLNDGTYTIAEVYERYIIVNESIVNESGATSSSVSVFGTTPVIAMDYFYNLIENGENVNFISKTDKGTLQKYSAIGLDASVSTPVYAEIGTESLAWVTETVSGATSELKIEGDGITDYKQAFKITQTFYVSPIWNGSLFNNLVSRNAPDYFKNGKHLKYVCQIDGKFNENSPIADLSGVSVTPSGVSSWFNQNCAGSKPEYKVESVEYVDSNTLEVLPKLVANTDVDVTIYLNSRSGKFVDTSEFILKHFLTPLVEADFINTGTTMLENLRHDEATTTEDAGVVQGINNGTDYQAIIDFVVTIVNANTAKLEFTVSYSTATQDFLRLKTDDNRYYMFVVSCQDDAITTTKNIDRVNVLCDYQTANFSYVDDSLCGLIDYIHCFPYPNTTANELNNFSALEGDFGIVKVPFWVETAVVNDASPILQSATIQIVSTKTGETDFVIEEKKFNVVFERKLDGIQTISLTDDRGFILAEGSEFNSITLSRRSDLDDGTKAAYEFKYPIVFRFESWIEVVQSAYGDSFDIFKDVENVVQAWKRYATGNGWALNIRAIFDVAGYDGYVNKFQATKQIQVGDKDSVPSQGSTFQVSTVFYDDSTADKYPIDGIIKGGQTRIQVTFLGDPTVFPSGMTSFFATLFATNNPSGSIFNRRFASTEFDSEEDSPFKTEGLPTSGAITEWESANLRIGIFADRVRIDTYYNDQTDNKQSENETVLFVPRLGYCAAPGLGDSIIGRTFIIA